MARVAAQLMEKYAIDVVDKTTLRKMQTKLGQVW